MAEVRTFFDKTGKRETYRRKSPHILWTFRGFVLSLPQRGKRRNGNHLQREILARNVSYRTDGQETPLSAAGGPKYIRVIDIMIDAPDVQGLLRYNSLNYEKLKGDKAGLSSVRVNDQYRIEFEEQVREGETIATICNITDLSNHYK